MDRFQTITTKQNRVIRVFVSSTFQDMKEEREELAKHVFPRLRKICERRGVTWGEVDLRWGITDEQKAEGKVLPICLREIEECRPYFICLLGERYGWIPLEIPEELVEREPWLAEHKDKSVTELEILHGVLINPEMSEHAFFYFRDPEFPYSIPAEKRMDFIEGPTPEEFEKLGDVEARRRAQGRREKLIDLKERIRSSGLPLNANYADPKILGELVFADLSGLIDRLFPEGDEPHSLDREATEHEGYAESRFTVYIGRDEYFRHLDDHVSGDGPPLVVLGDSGSGKSALLATWSKIYRETHPDDLLILHFIGSTPQSADWTAMLRRIMGEFKRRFDIQEDIPTEPEKLKLAFANWLHMVNARAGDQRVVLILDALNQLENREDAPGLPWLPPFIPGKIRLILSTLPGSSLDDLKKRAWPTLTVEPLDIEEQKQLTQEYLGQYRKSLDDERVQKIIASRGASNPLFLRVLLDELRLFGVHQHLDRAIEHYLSSKSIPELYEKVLKRLEQDYDREWPGLVQDAMSCIWASRRGLSEAELLDLLGAGDTPMPHRQWADFYSAVQGLIISRSGLLCFAHDYIREAIHRRFLQSEDSRLSAHSRIADYFTTVELGPRKIDELPWQLSETSAWLQLYDLLSDHNFLVATWEKDTLEIKAYWAKIENSSQFKLRDAYSSVLNTPGEITDNRILDSTSSLLSSMGFLAEAHSLYDVLTQRYRDEGNDEMLADILRKGSVVLLNMGDFSGALKLVEESEGISYKLKEKLGLSKSLSHKGMVLFSMGDYDKTLELFREAEAICRELGDRPGISQNLNRQVVVHSVHHEYDRAMQLLEEAAQINRELGDKLQLSKILNNIGVACCIRGDYDAATRIHRENEQFYRELGDKQSLTFSLNNQAYILLCLEDYEGVIKLCEESGNICREIGFTQNLPTALTYRGHAYLKRGEYATALDIFNENERVCRELHADRDLSFTLINQGEVLIELGRLDEAFKPLKEAESISRNLKLAEPAANSLVLQADLLLRRGEPEKGLPLAEEALSIATEHGITSIIESSKAILDKIQPTLG